MRETLVILGVLIGILFLAIFITFNVPSGHSITISADSNTFKYILTSEQRPGITPLSLQDTPYGNLKILTVRSHFRWGGEQKSLSDQLSDWLDDLGIESYPDYPIKYIRK